ncbi:MAG: 16S rRNA (cytidine(1402)-2'-O)-methyltransferase [Bdellovibrionaceae bacterium]|jgi:16S rRNA (cytidine1402-2'-O)-methyltransferase|nr:16S rRNA (cytidine(1402)-2'-O)-methyltransferase [Pseudobdellovibrionaceae bacterium]
MSLSVIATPIGNLGDISYRSVEILKAADLIIGEERKVVSKLIKHLSLGRKEIELLNEHSDQEDLDFLLNECRIKTIALVSDCGTPGFCDPGALLVKACRKAGIKIDILPGASSLMSFLSGCGERLDQFFFRGFIPAKNELRLIELQKLKKINEPIILMDTPYRLTKTLEDLCAHFPSKKIIIATDLTKEAEVFAQGSPKQLLSQFKGQKLEFILAIL